MSDFTDKCLMAYKLAQLVATPPANREALKAEAATVLQQLHEGLTAYPTEDRGAAESLYFKAKAAVPEPEPWSAFIAGGPSKPPPAVYLFRPPLGDAGPLRQLFDALVSWTGPGMLANIVMEGKLPDNPLRDVVEDTMKAAIGPIAEGLKTALKWIVAALVVGGTGYVLYRLATRPRPTPRMLFEEMPRRRRLPVVDTTAEWEDAP